MKIIDTYSLLSQNEKALLKHLAAESFRVGKFSSLDDILQQLNVDVIIEPGIPVRPIPSALEDAETYWRQMLDVDPSTTRQHLEEIWKDKENWSQMSLRGLYDPKTNIIKLYPEEMQMEYDGKKMKELLVSTLAHETMHAYFNRPGHDMFPYAIFVEEPLAEFGMLLYLQETGGKYYQWAYKDVSSKKTCYRYGANLMTQYLNGDNSIKTYLEKYKMNINPATLLGTATSISPLLPSSSGPISVAGQSIFPHWKFLINIPSYFWDENTLTLGIDGDWDDMLIHLCLSDEFKNIRKIKHLYIGDNFRILKECHLLLSLLNESTIENCMVIVSPNNKNYVLKSGILMDKHDWVVPIYPSCGDGFYKIPNRGKWGIVNYKGNPIVLCHQYDSIWSFDENDLCMVRIDTAAGYNYGYINKSGIEQIPVKYQHIYSFENGVTVAKKGDMYGIINEKDEIVHDFTLSYPDIRGIRNGYATMRDTNDKWGAIDAKGNVVVGCIYDSLVVFDKNGLAKVKYNGKEITIDVKGQEI